MAETTIQEELKKLQSLQLSQKEVLDLYSHIQLNEEELMEALISAKIKNEERLKLDELRAREELNRKRNSLLFDLNVFKTYLINTRAKEIFKYDFIVDDENIDCFDLLCRYFVKDEQGFIEFAEKAGVKNPSINKGILLCGNFGTGKTDMMKLFQKNQRRVYFMYSAKQIAEAFSASKDKSIPDHFILPFQLSKNDNSTLNQDKAGLCIDDIGSEPEKNNFGNVSNVIGDLIEQRYDQGFVGELLHGTTNLSGDQIASHYGPRVVSRMRQWFNFIELGVNDRRK